MKNSVTLTAGDTRVELYPELGGAVASFTWRGKNVFRPSAAEPTDVLETANFALVPYCNRIPHGNFEFGGHTVHIEPNLLPQPHPLHGQGWRAPWNVEFTDEANATLSYAHPAGEWPWPYVAKQTVTVSHQGLRQELSVTNTGDEPMPAGLGFHPYFHAPAGTTLQTHVEGAFMIDDEILPTVYRPGPYGADWTTGASVKLPDLIDHCYTGWDQRATLRQPDLVVTMTAPPRARWLHLYVPPGEDYLCVEPVTNRPDPFGGDGDSGIVTLKPGDTLSTWMQVDVTQG